MLYARISSTGSYLPEKIITNADLEKSLQTSDDWITERTGIKERRIASAEQNTSDLAYEAAKIALTNNKSKLPIDGIIVATTTPDKIFPSTAAIVQRKLGLQSGFAFDINAVCTGFIYALTIANSMIKAQQAKRILVIGAECMSKIVDWNDRATCILFGDGAGAVVLEASTESGILSTEIHCDGNLTEILQVPDSKIIMNGKEVFKHAVEKMTSSLLNQLEINNLQTHDIDWLLPHQANIRILNAVADRLGIAEDRTVSCITNHSNTSAASIPLALDSYVRNGKIQRNQKVAITAVGAGLTWGAGIFVL
jgi:3-oxoacyl-[acyl-carrier-protein] synthase-3